jgi:Icc-related predicted phosphoesterase
MKIALASDLHLEFGNIELHNTENADVLILSGDICVASDLRDWDSYDVMGENVRSQEYHKFFQQVSHEFKDVIYIMGNHEHYHNDYVYTHRHLCQKLSYIKNLHILNNQILALGDVVFFGGTLWTDMNKEDPETMLTIRGVMNDFRIVDNSNNVYKTTSGKFMSARLTPKDVVNEHNAFLLTLKDQLEIHNDQKFVVVGHHAPSKLSTHPRYKDEVIMNGAYSSDLSEFILDNPRIRLWTHGHTHEPFDYTIGETRIVCNPRGYIRYEERAEKFELKFLEIF